MEIGNIRIKKEKVEQELRPLRCELNILTRSDGSAMLVQGNTAVVVAMYGPVEVKVQRLLIDKASVEAVYRPKTGLPRIADKTREHLIRNTCENAMLASLYPRSAVKIIVQEMQDCGGLLACAVNASCLSLINSGISMKCVYAAVNCMIDNEDNIILDPTNKQLIESRATLTFVFESVNKNVLSCSTTGIYSQVEYQETLLKCREFSDKIFDFYKDLMKKYVNVV